MDNFKEINDRLGHKAGERILQRIVYVIRGTDIISRLGGDEFMLLLPEMKQDGALKALERVRARIKTKTKTGHSFRLSISMGVIACMPGKETAEKLISTSDELMCQIKHSGKDGMIIK